jgi:cation diffusion facilitator family transporter
MAQEDASLRAILYALVANLGIALSKTWAAVFTGSGSMLAEAVHSYADAGNQVLLFVGLKQSQLAPDAEHPLGYGKLSYFWSFIVALLLFSLGGLFSIYEGIHKLLTPEPLNQPWTGVAVLAAAIVLEAFSLAGALREIRRLRGARPLLQWLRFTRNAELVVVLGEDIAALIGLALACVFLGLTVLTGNPAFDAVGSMAIGVVLVLVSLFVAGRIRGLIVGRSAEPELQAMINRITSDDPAIDRLLNSITIQVGPKIMLAAKILMRPGLTLEEAVARINALERRLKAEVPQIGWCFMEPDIED